MSKAQSEENMSSATEVEEVFTIESGSGLINVIVTSLTTSQDGQLVTKIVRQLDDTSFFIFTEREVGQSSTDNSSQRRIALIKLGPDVYYPLEKNKTIVYRIDADRYLLPATHSTPSDQYLVVKLTTPPESDYLRKQFDEILNYFSTLVIEVPGASPELDAIRVLLGIVASPVPTPPTTGLYPPLEIQDFVPSAPPVPGASAGTLPPSATQQAAEPSARAKYIAQGLMTGAEYIASGLNFGTVYAEKLVHKGGVTVVERQTVTESKHVDPKVITALKTARVGADVAANVSTKVVSAVATGTRSLSERLVPHIHHHGSRLVSNVTGKDAESSSQTMNDILSVTAGGLYGFGTLYNCVTENAKVLAKAVASETVNYVNKRYGNDAGEATHEALYAAGSGYVAATCVSDLAPKAMVKKAAKEAGKTVVGSYAAAATVEVQQDVPITNGGGSPTHPTGTGL